MDSSALVALLDASEVAHEEVRALYDEGPRNWVVPAVIIPEVDYFLGKRFGPRAQRALLEDLAEGLYAVDWATAADLQAAQLTASKHHALNIGYVDAMVIAAAERLHASAIATLDLRHFAAISIKGNPKLLPRDAA